MDAVLPGFAESVLAAGDDAEPAGAVAGVGALSAEDELELADPAAGVAVLSAEEEPEIAEAVSVAGLLLPPPPQAANIKVARLVHVRVRTVRREMDALDIGVLLKRPE